MSALKLAAALSDMQTVGQGRAALGVITSALRHGYQALEDVSTGGGDLRGTNREVLDNVNAYAVSIYAGLPTAEGRQADALGIADSAKIGLCASQTDDALDELARSIKVSDFDFAQSLHDAVEDVGKKIGEAAGTGLGKGIWAALFAFARSAWPLLLLVVVALVVWRFRGRLFAAAAGGAS